MRERDKITADGHPMKGQPRYATMLDEVLALRADNARLRSMYQASNRENDDLRAENSRLLDSNSRMRLALKPFALVADDFDADGRTMKDEDGIYANTAADFRTARAVLGQS